jgi:hypothetical protein
MGLQAILELISDALGLLSAVATAVPFFRENRIKQVVFKLQGVQGSVGEDAEESGKIYRNLLDEWSITDWRFTVGGIALLGVSFFLKLVSKLAAA